MIKNYPEKIPVTWAGMQLMSINIGLLSVLLLKTSVRKKGGLGGSAPQTLTRSYYFEPPLSKKRSRATVLKWEFFIWNGKNSLTAGVCAPTKPPAAGGFTLRPPGVPPPLPNLGCATACRRADLFFALHRYFRRIDLSFCTSTVDITEANFCNTVVLLWVIEDQSHQKWVMKKKGWEPLS